MVHVERILVWDLLASIYSKPVDTKAFECIWNKEVSVVSGQHVKGALSSLGFQPFHVSQEYVDKPETNAGGFSWKTLSFGIPRSFQKWPFAFCGYANHGASSSLHFEECFATESASKPKFSQIRSTTKMHIETHYEFFSGQKPFATIWNMQNQLYDVPGGFSLYTLSDPNSVPIHQFKAYDYYCGPKLLHSTFTYGEAKHKPFLCHKNHHNPVSQKILKYIPHTRLST